MEHAKQRSRFTYEVWLALAFGVEFFVLSIAPHNRQDWLLENIIVVVGVGALVFFRQQLALSRASHTMIFIFLAFHEVGAHFTYSEVPYDAWFQFATGVSLDDLLGWRRNNYDRVLHFLSGLLLAMPVREWIVHQTRLRGTWAAAVVMSLLISSSALYELVEWAAALVFGGELGTAYLGTQGDVWDAQKDMALAALGALLGLVATARRKPL